MKRLILSATCALFLVGCGGPPAGPNQNVGQPVQQSEIKLPAPTIKVFVENSGSMDGYVKGATDFENAATALMEHALDNGGKDNISLIMISVEEDD